MLDFLNVFQPDTIDLFMQIGNTISIPHVVEPEFPNYVHITKDVIVTLKDMVVGSTLESFKIIDAILNGIYQTPIVKYPSMVIARVVEVAAGWKDFDEAFADLPYYWKMRVAEDLIEYKDVFKHIILK